MKRLTRRVCPSPPRLAAGVLLLLLAGCGPTANAGTAAATPSATLCPSPVPQGGGGPRVRPSGSPGFPAGSTRGAGAAAGQVTEVKGVRITVDDRRTGEPVVVITDAATQVRRGTATVKLSDIKVGDTIVVMGQAQPGGTVLASSIQVQARNGCPGNRRPPTP
jgi:hypothetical protein